MLIIILIGIVVKLYKFKREYQEEARQLKANITANQHPTLIDSYDADQRLISNTSLNDE